MHKNEIIWQQLGMFLWKLCQIVFILCIITEEDGQKLENIYIGLILKIIVFLVFTSLIKQFDFWLQVLAKFWPQSAQIKFKFLKADNLFTYPEKWGKCTKFDCFLYFLYRM